jgi:hypothetical protein
MDHGDSTTVARKRFWRRCLPAIFRLQVECSDGARFYAAARKPSCQANRNSWLLVLLVSRQQSRGMAQLLAPVTNQMIPCLPPFPFKILSPALAPRPLLLLLLLLSAKCKHNPTHQPPLSVPCFVPVTQQLLHCLIGYFSFVPCPLT